MLHGKPISNYKLNMLCSFAYFRKEAPEYTDFFQLFDQFNFLVDSGGFTNYWNNVKNIATGKKFKPITVDEYSKFCFMVDNRVYGYIALDLPRNSQVTIENLARMTDKGLRPMPVFAESMDFDIVPELIKVNERMCVAGAVYSADEYIVQRYQKVMKLTDNKAKIHALGLGRFPLIYLVPIATADSSTWTNASRYGTCSFFEPEEGMIHISPPMSRRGKPKSNRWVRAMGYLSRFNVNESEFWDIDNWRMRARKPSFTGATMSFAYIRFMYYLREVKDINYFVVLPSLKKGGHFSILLATMASSNDLQTFDYQVYKQAFNQFVNTPEEDWSRIAGKTIKDFYAKLTDNFSRDQVQFPRASQVSGGASTTRVPE